MKIQQFLALVKRSEHDIVVLKGDDALRAVTQDGDALQYVTEQTPEVVLAAVTQNGDALRYVKEQTPEVVLAAVTEDGDALRYVDPSCFEL